MFNKFLLLATCALPLVTVQANDSHQDSHETPHILSYLYSSLHDDAVVVTSTPTALLFPELLINNTNKDTHKTPNLFILSGGIYELELNLTLNTTGADIDLTDLSVSIAYILNGNAIVGTYLVSLPNAASGANSIALTAKIPVTIHKSTLQVQAIDITDYEASTPALITVSQANISVQRLSDHINQ